MGSEWRQTTLDQLGTIITGKTPPSGNPTFFGGDIPFVTPSDMDGRRLISRTSRYLTSSGAAVVANSRVPRGAVMVSCIGSDMGKAAVAGSDCVTNQQLNSLAVTTDDDPLFIYYNLSLRKAEIRQAASGSAQPILNKTAFGRLPIRLPSPSQQRWIAQILGALDDKIELNRRMSQTLESMARGYVDRAIADRPMVPYHTAVKVRMGAPFKGEAFRTPGNGRPLLRIRDLKTFASDMWTTEIRRDETVIRRGDIVVGMDAEFRATLWLGPESVLNQRVCSFRGLNGVGRAFVLYAMEPELAFQEQAKTGTTVIHLNKADIDTFMVPELSATEHQDLATATEPLIELLVTYSTQNHTLRTIRDTLIARLLSSHIRVRHEVSA